MKAPKIQLRKVADLQRDPDNARTHSEGQIEQIAASIRRFGFTSPLLADDVIRAGNGRHAAAELIYREPEALIHLPPGPDRGGPPIPHGTVPVIDCTGWSADERRAYALADNQLAAQAGWDESRLADQLQGLLATEFDIGLIGFDSTDLDRLLGRQEGQTDPDEVPATPERAVSRPGDIWLLGDHRLICGSCTEAAIVKAVLAGETPLLMVTDPPYGVNYDPKWRERELDTWKKPRATGQVQNDDRADWTEAWELFPGDVAYVWHGGLHAAEVARSLEACGFAMRAQIIWRKQHFVISRGDYHWQHEPCQPAGTLVAKVVKPGRWRDESIIDLAPIETLKIGDKVVSFGNAKVYRRGREITRIGSRLYSGNLHAVAAGRLSTRATAEHQFTIRFDPSKSKAGLLYLMRRGDRWRIGICGMFNSRGFGLAVRLAQERGEQAWIIGAFADLGAARIAEQIACCQYGIPTTHWETDRQVGRWAYRDKDGIDAIYRQLGTDRIAKGVARLMADHGLHLDLPLITADEAGRFSRKQSRIVRACNLIPGIMQLPIPTVGEKFEWRSITEATFKPVKGMRVWSMDVEGDRHYVADGIVTHNCWYAVRKGKPGHYVGDRKQSTIWDIANASAMGGDLTEGSTGHGTQKPVECMRRPITHNSKRGEAVYEPFCGSGTSIVACQMIERRCLAVELDPLYVDVAVMRWERFTGLKAVLAADNREFTEVSEERLAEPA